MTSVPTSQPALSPTSIQLLLGAHHKAKPFGCPFFKLLFRHLRQSDTDLFFVYGGEDWIQVTNDSCPQPLVQHLPHPNNLGLKSVA